MGTNKSMGLVKFHQSISDIGKEKWNGLVGTSNPFLRYEFLWALEHTKCTTRHSGWQPYHIGLYEGDVDTGALVAVVPLYLKTDSYGEYVFDWSWADAYRSAGLSYYPKFVTAVPFTPSWGARVFKKSHWSIESVLSSIISAVKSEALRLNVSSWHILFPTLDESEVLDSKNIHQRVACQFHWQNEDYSDFDAFLSTLNSRKRKNIKKERKAVRDQAIGFEVLEGENISEDIWQQFYSFYQSTYYVRGRKGYLSKEFFLQIGREMPEDVLLVLAKKDHQAIAAALSFKNKEKLFGRYWGCLQEYQFLHFETCFYQGIEYCIEKGLQCFDSGAQGEHKIQRGFRPIKTYSNHWIAQADFDGAIAKFLKEEKTFIESYIESARKSLPFKRGE